MLYPDADNVIEIIYQADISANATGNPQAIVDRTGKLLVVPAAEMLAGDRLLEVVRPIRRK